MSDPSRQPVYPIPRPVTGQDDRFTLGLALDVAQVLTRHGYPPLTTGPDLLRLQQALFTTIYQPATLTQENS
jgi:hypothetical protein